jgi:predicted transcriptional regulator
MNKKENIKKAISLLKEYANLTAYQIAKDTKITEKTIFNYRNEETKPTEANAKVLIQYFDVLQNAISLLENNKKAPYEISQNTGIMPDSIILDYREKKKTPTLEHAYKLIRYFEEIKENIEPEAILPVSAIISIPVEVWDVIKNQSDSLKKQSDSLQNKDEQISKVISLLERQIEESKKTFMQVVEVVTSAAAK